MNVIKEMNICESEFLTQILDKYIEVSDSVYTNYVQNLEREFKELYILLSTRDSSVIEYAKYKFFQDVQAIKYFDLLVTEEIGKHNSEAIKIFDRYQMKLRELCDNKRDFLIAKKKLSLSIHKSHKLQNDIINDMLSNTYFSMENIVNKLQEYIPEEYTSLRRKEDSKEVSIEIKNIYSHKDMEDLAIENGYSYVRASGDHLIYKHEVSNRIVVIPAHSLARGLSMNIQKQIYSRKGV